MYKNLLKSIAFAALAIVAGACAKEQVASGNGDTVEATFNVDVPETTITTKGLSDAAQVDELICQVFLNDGNYTPVPDLNQTVDLKNKKAKVTFNLVKGQKYSFAFWAQVKGTGYYNTGDLRAVKMNVDAVKANDPAMDAYFAQKDFSALSTPVTDIKKNTVPLYRAVAQVNFGTINSDRADKLEVVKSKIKLTEVPTVFDVVRGNKDDAYSVPATIEFKENVPVEEKLLVAGNEYDYLSTCYVFAYKAQKLTDATATFWVGSTSRTVSAPNAPYKRNMRTNILGDLLTINQDFNIVLDPNFKGGDKTYDAVSANLEAGKEVTLLEDYFVADESRGVTLGVGVTSVLNLNGKKFENRNGNLNPKAALKVNGGELTINGEGNVYCEKNPAGYIDPNDPSKGVCSNCAIVVTDGGHLIINGGHYSVGTDFFGKCNSTIYVEKNKKTGKSGKVEIYGGTFTNDEGSNGHSFVLNQDDELTEKCITVYGGTFIGFNPADNTSDGAHTNYVAAGYHSTKVSTDPATGISTYVVTREGVTPVVDQAGLDVAMANLTSEPATISLPAGNFSTYGKEATKGKTLTFNGAGAENTNFIVGKNLGASGEGNSDYSLENADVTFNDLTRTTGDGLSYNYRGFVRAKSLTFVNCTIKERLSYWGGVVKFINCKFEPNTYKKEDGSILPDYNITTYQGTEFSFENCSFKSAGKFMNLYKDQNVPYVVRVKDCTFIATKIDKPVLNMKSYTDVEYKIYFEGTNIAKTEAGVEFPLYGGETASNAEVYVNNTLVWSKGQAF